MKHEVALFDLDGVVINTESQYTGFWAGVGERYFHSGTKFANMIKGATLVQIFDKYFRDAHKAQREITASLDDFEKSCRMNTLKVSRNLSATSGVQA